MKNKIIYYFKEIVLFIVVMTIFANILSLYRSQELNKDKLNISTFELLNSSFYTLPKNEPLLIHFWATWCPTCKAEASNIQTISQKYNVITVALKSGSDEELEEYLKNRNNNFKVYEGWRDKLTRGLDENSTLRRPRHIKRPWVPLSAKAYAVKISK